MRRRVLALVLFCTLGLAPLVPGPAHAAPPPLDWDIPEGHFFTQANGYPLGTSPMGFSVTDRDGALLWTEYQRLGGVERLGYPASRRFLWDGFVTQVMQKAVLQWRPEAQAAYYVNVFDDLTRAGKDDLLAATRAIPRPLPADSDGEKAWPALVEGRLALLRARPQIEARYRAAADPLSIFGLPQSEVADMGSHYAVRLQRAVLQEWKVDVPWARAGEVTVANGGDVGKEAGIFPAAAMRPTAPFIESWQPTEGAYRLEGEATWYGESFQGRPMANGAAYDPNDPLTAACNAYPLGSRLRVTAALTGQSIEVEVRDAGPFTYPRVVDLSPAAFVKLGHPTSDGRVPVTLELLVDAANSKPAADTADADDAAEAVDK